MYINGFILEACHVCMASFIISVHGNVNNSKLIQKNFPRNMCYFMFAANFSGVSPGWMVVIVTNDLARNGCYSNEAAHVLYVSVEDVEQTGRH